MAKVAKKAAAPPKAARGLKKQQKAQVAAAAKKPVKKVRSRHDMLLRVFAARSFCASCARHLVVTITTHCGVPIRQWRTSVLHDCSRVDDHTDAHPSSTGGEL